MPDAREKKAARACFYYDQAVALWCWNNIFLVAFHVDETTSNDEWVLDWVHVSSSARP